MIQTGYPRIPCVLQGYPIMADADSKKFNRSENVTTLYLATIRSESVLLVKMGKK